jgi:hypothetical protein
MPATMQTEITRLEFKVLVYREEDYDRAFVYIAQCLNYDLAAQGETVAAVLSSLESVIKTQIQLSLESGIEPFSDFRPAPPKFLALYENENRAETAFSFSFDVPSKERPFSGVALMKLAA